MKCQTRPEVQSAVQAQGLGIVQSCPETEIYSPDQPLTNPSQLKHKMTYLRYSS